MAPARPGGSSQGHKPVKENNNNNLKTYYGVAKAPARSQHSFGRSSSFQKTAIDLTENALPFEEGVLNLTNDVSILQERAAALPKHVNASRVSTKWPVEMADATRSAPLSLYMNFNVPTPFDLVMDKFCKALRTAPIHLHIGDAETCLDFLDYYPECLGRIEALAMRASHTQDPKRWMELFERLANHSRNVRYLDMFWDAPSEPWAFPRCGPNPWSKDENILAMLGSIDVMAGSRTRGIVKIGGLYPDSTATFLEQKMGGTIIQHQ